MSENIKAMNFKILNTNISVMAGDDAEHVRAIAADVSELLEGIRAKNPLSNHVQVAVIGCMNLAEELRELKDENSNLKRALSESNKRADFLYETLENRKIEVAQLQKNITTQEQATADLSAQIAAKEIELARMVEQLNQAKTDYENARQSVLSLQNQLFEIQIELSRYTNNK